MNIMLNEQLLEIEQPLGIEQPLSINALLEQLGHDQPGCALAINQTIIPHTDWATHHVQDGDDILLFQAIAGG